MTNSKKTHSKMKMTFGTVAGIALLGIGAASAANLGINANNELGAGTSVTASCQPAGEGADIAVGFNTPEYNSSTQGFDVSAVELSALSVACDGKSYEVVVSDADGANLGSSSGTVSGTTVSASLSSAVDSSSVEAVSVVIYD